MDYSKKELEVIAYSLALLESELEKNSRNIAHKLITDLQNKGIFGII